MRHPALVLSLVLLSAVARPALAADCDGADVTRLRLRADRLGFEGSITAPGLNHFQLASRFAMSVVDADDGTVLYRFEIPSQHFVSGANVTVYDGRGAFPGSVELSNATDQHDTVEVKVRARGIAATGTGTTRDLRVRFDTATGCALTCVSDCRSKNGRLGCDRSALYLPFADAGFGARTRPARRPTSGYCGLEIDADSGCDFLIDERCVLPYPSSHFLQPDPATPTKLRLRYPTDALPRNLAGKPIDPTDWNTLDGYSPGPMILALFPDTGFPVDLVSSGVAFHTDFARSLDEDHPTVLVDDASGERVVHFAEMDANTNDLAKQAMIIRPGVRLRDASHYVVGIRDLVDGLGTPIRPRLAFRALRDGESEENLARACGDACAAAVEARRATFDETFATLADAGVPRSDLLLAWDFTTASSETLTDWIVSVRDQAFALGTPTFTVTSVENNGGAGLNQNIHTRIQGTFRAPMFTTVDAPGARLNMVNGMPAQNGWATVPYVVEIPHVAINSGGQPQPGRPTLWGHGLLGDRFQLRTLAQLAQQYDFVLAAVDMQGMSSADVAAIIPVIQDYSLFHRIPERLHQGFLNHLLLGRLLVDPVNGFNSHPAFRFGSPATGVIDTTAVYYSGGSQGGIFGTAIMSVAEDFERGFLAVPGANYSTLLRRSIDFNPFLAIHRVAYPDDLDETIIMGLVQQLWDRAEPNGYYPHLLSGDLSDPPRPHKVLMHMARYDSEVSNLSTEIMVRSLGFPQVAPVINHFFGIPEQEAPFDGSALVEIDPRLGFSRCIAPGSDSPGAACTTNADCPGAGDPPSRTRCDSGIPPLTNTPPTFNNRAHGSTGVPTAGAQIDAFLRPGGRIENFCDGPCDPE